MRAGALLLALIIGGYAGARASAPPPDTAAPEREAYTLVNLHPDEEAKTLYSINYLRSGLIPLCSKVTVQHLDDQRMVFVVHETGKQYDYLFHDRMYESPEDNLKLYFGPSCDPPPPSSFTVAEQAAIRKGLVEVGMSKQAVLLAIGYPPWHGTPSLKSDTWRYWQSRYNTIAVLFRDGRVVRVKR